MPANKPYLCQQLHTHVRLWCGDDLRLQRALDWLGAPYPAPDAANLAPEEIRKLLATFSDLWAAAVAIPSRPAHTPEAYGDDPDEEEVEILPPNFNPVKGSPRDLLYNELAGQIARLASATLTKTYAELAALLRKLRAQCGTRENVGKSLDRGMIKPE